MRGCLVFLLLSQEQQKSFKLVNLAAPTATALFIAPELAVIDDDGGVEKQIRQTELKMEGGFCKRNFVRIG